MQMRLLSLLVLIFAFLGNSKASAIVNTAHVLSNLEVAEKVEVSSSVSTDLLLIPVGGIRNFQNVNDNIDKEERPYHRNSTIHRLTFYYSSRLRN